MEDTNPVRQLRIQRRVSIGVMARGLGVSYNSLLNTELGYYRRIPPRVMKGLSDLGCDADELQRRYAEWRDQGRNELASGVAV